MSAHDNTLTPSGHGPGHEGTDVNIKLIVVVLSILAGMAAIVCVLVYGIFAYLADHPLSTVPPNPMAETATQQFPPAPRLQVHPTIELEELRSEEDKILSTYGWTDKNAGIARVPIDRAIDLALQRGFATRPNSPNAGAATTANKAAPK